MAVPQSVSGGVSPSEQREVCAALLRINGSRFDLLRGIMVCMRSVFSECMGISYPECRYKLPVAESVLLHLLRTQSFAAGESCTDQKKRFAQTGNED
jgi:hypothetical protein